MKCCTKCKQTQPKSNFYYRPSSKENLNAICKVCLRKNVKKYRNKSTNTLEGYLAYRLYSVKGRAKRKNTICDITVADLMSLYKEQKGLCKLSQVEMTCDGGRKKSSLSIDRIDNTKGYTKDNIQMLCYIVNIMKLNMKSEELIFWCSKIMENTK